MKRRGFLAMLAALVAAPLVRRKDVPAFTSGGFYNFGSGTLAHLHGTEDVITRAELDAFVRDNLIQCRLGGVA